jgi:hypothetical protein
VIRWASLLLTLRLGCEPACEDPCDRGRDQLRLNEIHKALQLWTLDQGRWPTEAEGLDALVRCAPSMKCDSLQAPGVCRQAEPGEPSCRRYLARPHFMDSCGRPFQYERVGDGVRLRALGADGQAGTVDDVVVGEPPTQ